MAEQGCGSSLAACWQYGRDVRGQPVFHPRRRPYRVPRGAGGEGPHHQRAGTRAGLLRGRSARVRTPPGTSGGFPGRGRRGQGGLRHGKARGWPAWSTRGVQGEAGRAAFAQPGEKGSAAVVWLLWRRSRAVLFSGTRGGRAGGDGQLETRQFPVSRGRPFPTRAVPRHPPNGNRGPKRAVPVLGSTHGRAGQTPSSPTLAVVAGAGAAPGTSRGRCPSRHDAPGPAGDGQVPGWRQPLHQRLL